MSSIFLEFDPDQLASDLFLSKSEVDDLMEYSVKQVTRSFASAWEQEAVRQLKSSRQQYVSSLVVVDEGRLEGAVVLVGTLPNMIESGADEFDMKIKMLQSPKAKTSKSGGKYITIPFKSGAPSSLPENFNGGILPASVHQVVKSFSTDSVTGKSRGTVKQDLPVKFQAPQSKSLAGGGEYTHKNSIYEGVRKSIDRAGNVGYESFRRISSNSDPNSWQFPGLEARHLAEAALSHFDVPSEVGRAIDEWWSARQ